MFPLSQPALCLDFGGGGDSRAESTGEKGRSRGRWKKPDEKREGEAKREMEELAFQKAIDRLPLKISYWISLTETAF